VEHRALFMLRDATIEYRFGAKVSVLRMLHRVQQLARSCRICRTGISIYNNKRTEMPLMRIIYWRRNIRALLWIRAYEYFLVIRW